ncbi:unnamed protein product [Haemonchus placei]|uniref:DUF2059 domain-containing protein n=1 Tax=Haemonchus placei TaxID=6290 RepID=A0A0N4WPT6_HAEPC|nr:unnamed protein product [Haemonchus placei]
MKRLVLALCLYLFQAAVASEADFLAALQAQEIPLQAQLLSGEELTEYLQKNQKFFEVEETPASDDFESRLMDLSFIDQNRKPIVQEAISTSGDIPERLVIASALILWSAYLDQGPRNPLTY